MSNKPDKLMQDAAAASAAGLSYGQWKASQRVVVEDEKPLELDPDMRKCRGCGIVFRVGKYKQQKFCTKVCQRKTHDGMLKARRIATIGGRAL